MNADTKARRPDLGTRRPFVVFIGVVLVCLTAIYLVFLRPMPFSGAGLVVIHIDSMYFYADDGSEGAPIHWRRPALYRGKPLPDPAPEIPFDEFGDVFWTAARMEFSGTIEWDFLRRVYVVHDMRSLGRANLDQVESARRRAYPSSSN